MIGICGNEKASDAVVTVDLNSTTRDITINSKLNFMFGRLMKDAVNEALDELNIKNAHVNVEDFGALDFVIKARTKTAAKNALRMGGVK